MKHLYLCLVLLLLASTLACSQRTEPPSPPSASPISPQAARTLSHSSGGVTVEVSPLRLPSPAQASVVFQVALDTHSVDLDAYDLWEGVRLRDGRGQELKPRAVDVPLGGHHRSGTITFEGSSLASTRYVELVLRGLAGVPERTFRWEIGK